MKVFSLTWGPFGFSNECDCVENSQSRSIRPRCGPKTVEGLRGRFQISLHVGFSYLSRLNSGVGFLFLLSADGRKFGIDIVLQVTELPF